MDNFQGYYINLEKDKERERILLNELSKCGKLKNYKRFNAVEGLESEHSGKSLRKGEDGIWKSWIELLGEIGRHEGNKYIHIIEDDVIPSKRLYEFIGSLKNEEPSLDIIMTDMYTNISVYKVMGKILRRNDINQSQKVWLTNQYTGCLASCLIHTSKIAKIKETLEAGFKEDGVIPIDNYLRKVNISGQIKIGTTLPYLTTVQLTSINNSSIQNRAIDNRGSRQAITKTQIYNTHLRRMLSVFKDTVSMSDVVRLSQEIMNIRGLQAEELNNEIINAINVYFEKEEILRYRTDSRLASD